MPNVAKLIVSFFEYTFSPSLSRSPILIPLYCSKGRASGVKKLKRCGFVCPNVQEMGFFSEKYIFMKKFESPQNSSFALLGLIFSAFVTDHSSLELAELRQNHQWALWSESKRYVGDEPSKEVTRCRQSCRAVSQTNFFRRYTFSKY